MENSEERFSLFNQNIEQLYIEYPILKEIDKNNLELIKKNVMFKDLLTNEYLKTAEESCSNFIFVLKGTIKIQRLNEEGEETNLYNISKGDFCHEALSCFVNYKSLNITGKAIQDSKIALIPADVVKTYFLEDQRFLKEIYKDLYLKFRNVIENKEERVHESLENRLIKLLISKKSNIIYATHNELAFELDSAREVISRKLKKLEKQGYIKVMRGKVQIMKDLNEAL